MLPCFVVFSDVPRAGFGIVIIDLLHFLAGRMSQHTTKSGLDLCVAYLSTLCCIGVYYGPCWRIVSFRWYEFYLFVVL